MNKYIEMNNLTNDIIKSICLLDFNEDIEIPNFIYCYKMGEELL